MSDATSLVLEPHLAPWLLAALGAVALLIAGYGIFRRANGAWLRLGLLALLLAALANPVLRRELRDPIEDLALVVVDKSPSQRLPGRSEQVESTRKQLEERLAAIPGLVVETMEIEGDDSGTRAFRRLAERLTGVDQGRLAGVLMLTDGQVHDVPVLDPDQSPPLGRPLHVLLTGKDGETDRRLSVDEAPGFAMVGEPQHLIVRFDELPSEASSATARLTVKQNGKPIAEVEAAPGTPTTIPFTLERAGKTTIEVEVATRPGELTALNNRLAIPVSGVRDRLRVLLVSGQPYPGLRVWRNLLKADAAVDLVHFTILRPPEKQDGTPIRELALIAFPSRELFEVKLGEFDLVIFDRYNRRGLLPLPYLENVARYVEAGGALLEAAGPEFASPTSLYRTPLARVLPGRPSGQVMEQPFLPTITDLGRRHPVTAGLTEDPQKPDWGQWFRQVDVEVQDAAVLMTGAAERPLLVLQRVGEGRVAQLLSDQAWLWARGVDQGGPQAQLLRRLVHWLMKEPELEEKALLAEAKGDGILITRRSDEDGPTTLTIRSPSGKTSSIELTGDHQGLDQELVAADEDGLWEVTDGEHTAYVMPRPIAPIELADMRATTSVLAPIVAATGGAMSWLGAEGVPEIRRVAKDRRTAGRGWIGLVQNEAYTVTGATRQPLLPPWLAMTLLLATAGLAWWREGRR